MSTLASNTKYTPGSPCQSKGYDVNGIQVGMGEFKPSLYADDLLIYTENPKDTTKNY